MFSTFLFCLAGDAAPTGLFLCPRKIALAKATVKADCVKPAFGMDINDLAVVGDVLELFALLVSQGIDITPDAGAELNLDLHLSV